MGKVTGIAAIVAGALLIAGCSSKEDIEFNKSADYWYQKMVTQISRGDLEKADQTFSSLQSEHMRSPLLEDATMMLAQAHMDREEYLLANYYLDEYIKRFADPASREYARFLKVKASFLGFKNAGRDQQLMLDTAKDARQFLADYPASRYAPMVGTMLTKLDLASDALNKEVAALYDKLGKPQGAAYYRTKRTEPWLAQTPAQLPVSPWYRRIFE